MILVIVGDKIRDQFDPGSNAGVVYWAAKTGITTLIPRLRNWMNELDKEFLLKLASLCEEYDASFSNTTDDEGIHISVDGGREVFVGFLIDAPRQLREAI